MQSVCWASAVPVPAAVPGSSERGVEDGRTNDDKFTYLLARRVSGIERNSMSFELRHLVQGQFGQPVALIVVPWETRFFHDAGHGEFDFRRAEFAHCRCRSRRAEPRVRHALLPDPKESRGLTKIRRQGAVSPASASTLAVFDQTIQGFQSFAFTEHRLCPSQCRRTVGQWDLELEHHDPSRPMVWS